LTLYGTIKVDLNEQCISINSKQDAEDSLYNAMSSPIQAPPSLKKDTVCMGEIEIITAVDGLTPVNVLRSCLRDIQIQKFR
jgi:hypothetical protein